MTLEEAKNAIKANYDTSENASYKAGLTYCLNMLDMIGEDVPSNSKDYARQLEEKIDLMKEAMKYVNDKKYSWWDNPTRPYWYYEPTYQPDWYSTGKQIFPDKMEITC